MTPVTPFTYEISYAVLSPGALFSCTEKDYIIDFGKGLWHISKLLWLKVNQRDYISQESFKALENSLCLKVDENALYRSTSRLNRAKSLPYNVKHPIILNRKHFLTNLIVLDVHERIKHNGERQTLAELEKNYGSLATKIS